MAHHTFISYSSHNAPWANALCELLEGQGLPVWMAPRDIQAGATWGEAIIQALNESAVMVLIFSEQADKSVQVLREVERAVAKHIPVIPLNIDGTAPSGGMEYFLSSCHWIQLQSLVDGNLNSSDCPRIIQAIHSAHEGFSKRETSQTSSPYNPKRRKLLIASGIGTLASGGGAWWAYQRATKVTVDPSAVAVLPFTNLSKQSDIDYLSMALPTEIECQVSRIATAVMRPFETVREAAQQTTNLSELAQALRVGTLVTGSFWKIDNQLRLNVKVLDTRADLQVWADSFETGIQQMLQLFEQLIPKVSQTLRLHMQEGNPASGSGTANNAAFDAYLKGLALAQQVTATNNQQSIALFQQAVAMDKDYARAWAGLAQAQTTRYYWNFTEDKAWLQHAQRSAAKAIELNDQLPEAHLAMAFAQEGLGNRKSAANAFLRASQEQSNFLPAQVHGARWLFYAGEFDRSLQRLDAVARIDPNHNTAIRQAMNHFFKGDIHRATDFTKRAIEMAKGVDQLTLVAFLSIWIGNTKQTEALESKIRNLEPQAFSLKEIHAWKTCMNSKNKAEAMASIEALKSRDSFGIADEIATLYAVIGEAELAVRWLGQAVAQGAPNLAWYTSHFFESVKNNLQYTEIISNLRNEYEALKPLMS